MSNIIELIGVWKIYKVGSSDYVALKNVYLKVSEGEFHCIIGPSGSGKTTLLNIIGGLERPSKGIVRVCDRELNVMSESELARFRNENIGFVFQQYYLIPRMTILENVELPLIVRGISRSERRKLALEALKLVGLEDHAYKRPSQLSGGEQQRATIARAVVTRPKILLADEPTGNLDPENARKVMNIFKDINKTYGITVVVVTHNLELMKYSDRVTRLYGGEIARTYTRDEISKLVEEFIKSK